MSDTIFSIDNMLKEIKTNLNKYEGYIKNIEDYNSEKSLKEIEKIQKTLNENFKMISPLIVKEEHKFILNSYKEIREELNKRIIKVKKNREKKNLNKKFDDLFNTNSNIENRDNLEYLADEHQSLNNCLKLSSDINNSARNTNNELDDQEKTLGRSSQQVVKILQKIPIIEQMFGKIKFHLIKEKLILGCVVGIIVILGLYLTFYR